MIQRMFVTIDTKKTNYKNVGKINHGDDLILELTVLSDGDMISFNNPMVDLLVKKSDGKMIRQNSGIEHIKPNKFIIEVSKDCVTSPGLSTNQLIINDNGRISTCMFYYTILSSLEEDIIESVSNVEVLEQLDEFTIQMKDKMENFDSELQNRMSGLEDAIDDLVESFGDTSVELQEAELSRNEAEQTRAQAESVRVQNESRRLQNDLNLANAEAERVRAENVRIQNEADRALVDEAMDQKESEREDSELERIQNESNRATNEEVRQQNENTRQSNESIRMNNEIDRKTQENRRVTAETNRVNAETTRRNNENSRISNEIERQKSMNEMNRLIYEANGFDERVGVVENKIEEINSSLEHKAHKNKISPKNYDSIQDCLNYASENGYNVEFPSKCDYTISETIYLPNNVSINFNNSIIRTNNDIVMLSTKDGEKLNNVKLENLILRGSGNSSHTNNIGIKFASIYGIFENFTITHCFNGLVQHSQGVAGNQVTNIFRNIKIRYVYDIAMILGNDGGNAITDGWLENINLGSGNGTVPANHLIICGCSGYFLKDIHTWGGCETSIKLYEVAHTNIDGLYIESFDKRAIDLHLKSECNMSNIKTIFNSNDECFMYLSGATTSLYDKYVLNIDNVVIGGKREDLTGLVVFNAENNKVINVNYSNIDVNLPVTFNGNTTKIKAKLVGVFSTNRNEICLEEEFVLSRTFKAQIPSGTSVSVDIPITRTFIGNAGTMINLQITLCRYWDDFSNNHMRLNKNLYVYCKNGGDIKIKEYDVETPIGFTTSPVVTFNNGMLNITFEKASASNGWLFATLI